MRRETEIRTRLAQFEADRRAEEEEVRAAIAAVEAAERQLREEREVEEARAEEETRELTRRETERVQQINVYFEYLRGVLGRVRIQQESAIEKRHEKEWAAIDLMRAELESPENAAKREAYVKSERDKINISTESTIKTMQRQHAASMMETISRHRKEQDELFSRSNEDEDQDAQILKAQTLQDLMPAQDLERTTLKSQQEREVQKWRGRGEASLLAFDSRMIALKLRLEEAENIDRRERGVRNVIFADGKWTETLFEQRVNMLAEDERKMVQNGAEAPSTPKRETVIMPSTFPASRALNQERQQGCSPAQSMTPLDQLMKAAAGRPLQVTRIVVPSQEETGKMKRPHVLTATWKSSVPVETKQFPAIEKAGCPPSNLELWSPSRQHLSH